MLVDVFIFLKMFFSIPPESSILIYKSFRNLIVVIDICVLPSLIKEHCKQDTLQILACKEMRLHSNRSPEASEMDEDSNNGSAATAKGRVVTQVAKKNLIQIAIPIFIELKRLLESKNSPLTGCLMDCLRALLKDYKNEIEEILVADKQLQKELLYDMQKHEDAAAAKAKSPAAATEGGPTPPGAAMRSVMREVNRKPSTPPLSLMSLPKVKSANNGGAVLNGERPPNLLESLRRRQSFESDDEN